ncbi:MAG TPA: hypothetical protein VLS93_11590 [Anaeromyxobacteraceae bacterium]|nr:hypothetical protein [Anaeromyxobacteraceae bacterium]
MTPRPSPARLLRAAPGLARVLLLAFAAWAVALELAAGPGFVAAVGSAPGVALVSSAGLLLLLSAADPLRPGAGGTRSGRVARALLRGGLGLLVAAPPLSLTGRVSRTLEVGEGMDLPTGSLPGLPALHVGAVHLAPRGPHLLSKTVEVQATPEGGPPVTVGLFPPARIGPWRLTVFKYGYAPRVEWEAGGRLLADGFLMLGTFPATEEEARLVEWSPEPNVMMGVGTFPPAIEDLVTPPGSGHHLFLRLEEGTVGGARRALASPEAYRFLADGRVDDPTLLVRVFRGSEEVFAGRLRGGGEARYPGGRVAVAPEVRLWVELLAVRDPFLGFAWAGAALLAAGIAAGAGGAAIGLARRRRGVEGSGGAAPPGREPHGA